MKQLKQKEIFEYREFLIKEDKIYLKIKDKSEINEWSIPFEDIGFKKNYKSYNNTGEHICALVFFSCFIAIVYAYFFLSTEMNFATFCIISFVTILLTGIFIFGGKKNELILYGGNQNIYFFQDKPNKNDVEEFIDLLHITSKKYLKNKYAIIDLDLPEDVQFSNYYWLKEIEVISYSEYEDLKSEYKMKKLF